MGPPGPAVFVNIQWSARRPHNSDVIWLHKEKIMRVFISYAREDYEIAKKIYDSLTEISIINPWIDQESLLPGIDWEYEIFDKIGKSRFVIVVLSNKSIDKTGFFQSEIQKAVKRFLTFPQKKILLIPVRVENCVPPNLIENLHYLDLFNDFDNAMKKLIRTIISTWNKELTVEKKHLKSKEIKLIQEKNKNEESFNKLKENLTVLKKKREDICKLLDNLNVDYESLKIEMKKNGLEKQMIFTDWDTLISKQYFIKNESMELDKKLDKLLEGCMKILNKSKDIDANGNNKGNINDISEKKENLMSLTKKWILNRNNHKTDKDTKFVLKVVHDTSYISGKINNYVKMSNEIENDTDKCKIRLSENEKIEEDLLKKLIEIVSKQSNREEELKNTYEKINISEKNYNEAVNILEGINFKLSGAKNELSIIDNHISECNKTEVILSN